MTSNTEWPTIDSSGDVENHSDLFTGDLFGDELLDMYNSVSEISNILPNKAGEDQNAPKAQGNATMDYDSSLGALAHSDSMRDFTSILEDNTPVFTSHNKILADMEQDPTEVKTVSGKKRNRDDLQPVATSAEHINPPAEKKQALNTTAPVGVQTVVANTPQQPLPVKTEVQTSAVLSDLNVVHAPEATTTVQEPITTVVADTVPSAQSNVILQSNKPTPVATTTTTTTATSVRPAVRSHPALVTPPQPAPKGNHIVANAAMVAPSLQSKDASSVSGNSVKTEESFKGVAQAAVTNLILSAGNAQRQKDENDPNLAKPIDTSTAHVAALTSNNWVAACAASISGAPPGTAQAAQAAALAAASDPAAAKAARARRASLTADERARQNRDRNREHARNTRLRKKAYVEELKRTLTELVTQRDAADVERRHEKQRDLEVREVRYRVMEEFLRLRARGAEPNLLARWIAILEDGFTLTMPKTEYRAMVNDDDSTLARRVSNDEGAIPVDSNLQVLLNANQCFDDASKLASYISSSVFMGNPIQMSYQCERSHFMMDGVKAILDWTLKATPQVQGNQYNASTFVIKGTMRATFSPSSNKLASAELNFDTGSVIRQIKLLKSQQALCPIEETDALLDSVLPKVSTIPSNTNQVSTLPSTVSVVSTEKDVTSDEEGVMIKTEPHAQTA